MWRADGHAAGDPRERSCSARARARESPRTCSARGCSHLALNCAAPAGYPRETLLLATDQEERFSPVDCPHEHLRRAARALLEGPARAVAILSRKAHTSLPGAFCRMAKSQRFLSAARNVWAGDEFPENVQAHFAFCFGALGGSARRRLAGAGARGLRPAFQASHEMKDLACFPSARNAASAGHDADRGKRGHGEDLHHRRALSAAAARAGSRGQRNPRDDLHQSPRPRSCASASGGC